MIGHQKTLRKLVRGKNISEISLLATDYLNHFNEIIMMVELIPTTPDCFEDAKSWQPMSYAEHFRTSCFTDKDLETTVIVLSNYDEPLGERIGQAIFRMHTE